jgi:cytochrome P450
LISTGNDPTMRPPADALAAVAHPDPYPFYAALRAERPFGHDDRLGLWVAADARAVDDVLAHPACRVRPPIEPVPAHLDGTRSGDVFGRFARTTDGAAHGRLKPPLAAALAAFDLAAIARMAETCATALLAEGGDLTPATAERLMFRLPAACVGAAIGIPDPALGDAVDETADFARGLAAAAPGREGGDRLRGDRAADALLARMAAALARPTGPLASLEAAARAAGVAESATIWSNALGLMFQAYEATAGLIGQALVAAARHPDHWEVARTSAKGVSRFVHEVLRHDPPVQNTRRFTADAATIAGRSVPAGATVLVILAAASRDPAVNPAPDLFDPARFAPDRPAPRLFTFGAGRHACPGTAVATTIAAAVLGALGGRITARFAAPVGYRPLANVRIPRFEVP